MAMWCGGLILSFKCRVLPLLDSLVIRIARPMR